MKRFWQILTLAFLLCACDETIIHDLPETHANKVLVALDSAGIIARKVRASGGWHVSVESSDTAKALSHIESSRILRQELLEVQKRQQPLILSKEERAHLLEREVADAIETTLERLPNVLEARVHLSIGASGSMDWEKHENTSSASALIITDKPINIEKKIIAQLISGAAGLKVEEISVLVSDNVTSVSDSKNEVIQETNEQTESIAIKQDTYSTTASYYNTVHFTYLIGIAAFLIISLIFVRKKSARRSELEKLIIQPPKDLATSRSKVVFR